MTTAEKLVKIAENEPKVYEAGRKEGMSFVSDNVGNALKGSASGETIVLKDVSPIEHNLGVKVESKNLISIAQGTTTISGVTFSADENGVITCNGISTGDIYYQINDKAIELVSGMYTLSGCPVGGAWDKYLIYIETEGVLFDDIGRGKSFEVKEDKKYKAIIYIPRNVTVENLVFKAQLEKGTTETAHTPYIADIEEVKILAQGGNILDFDLCIGNGLEKIGDNTYRLSWKINQWGDETRFSERAPFVVPVNTKLVFSYELVEKSLHHNVGDNIEMYVRLLDKSYEEAGAANVINGVGAFEVTQEPATFEICLLSRGQFGDYVIFKNPQLKIGTTATEYEPYKEPIEYSDGEDIKSIYPSTTLMTDTEGAIMTVEYNRDINAAFAELLQRISSLGG